MMMKEKNVFAEMLPEDGKSEFGYKEDFPYPDDRGRSYCCPSGDPSGCQCRRCIQWPGTSRVHYRRTGDVPDLRGKTEEEAREELERLKKEEKTYLGMKVETERQPSSEYPEGQIMSQDPEPGEKVDQNTTIKVIISSGEEPETVEVPKFWARKRVQRRR